MTEKIINPEKDGKLPLSKFKYIEFETLKEFWNKYRLEDGSILKTKLVLVNILGPLNIEELVKKSKDEKSVFELDLSIQSHNVIGVEVPSNLLGEPSKGSCSVKELNEYIIAPDLDYETVSESHNRYHLILKNTGVDLYLKVKNSPVSVSRTSKFDKFGIPMYVANFTASVLVSSKEY
jgi:hypothetical protein